MIIETLEVRNQVELVVGLVRERLNAIGLKSEHIKVQIDLLAEEHSQQGAKKRS